MALMLQGMACLEEENLNPDETVNTTMELTIPKMNPRGHRGPQHPGSAPRRRAQYADVIYLPRGE